jgi:integrase
MKLTQRRIDLLQCPAGKKDALVFDGDQKGLGVRVTASGAKNYLAQYARAGAKRRVPLGSCDAISLAAAREATKAILGDVAKGRDPAAERKEAELKARREALTLDSLIEQWAALHLSGKRTNYSASAVSALRRVFARRLEAPAADLDRAAAVRALDDLAKNGKVQMAASTARYGSALFGWAVKRGSVALNPFEGVPIAPLTRRDRVLSDEEIRLIWDATEEPGTFNAIVRALLLTGQRREEVTGLTWAEIDEALSGWTLPGARTKNGKPHFIPLSEQMRVLLRAQPRFDADDLVFPGERGVFSGWSKSKDRLDQRCGISGWTLHDLRRTAATGLQKLGVRLEVTEAILNHVSGSRAGIVGVYQRHHWADEKRTGLAAWGAHVAAIVEGREAEGNVTPIRARAGAV